MAKEDEGKSLKLGTSRSPFATNALTASRARQMGSGAPATRLAIRNTSQQKKSSTPIGPGFSDYFKQQKAGQGATQEEQDLYRTFEEIFGDLMGTYGERTVSTGGGGIDRSPFDQASARIAAIYRQLENSFGPDAEAMKQLFAKTAQDYAANAAQAESSIRGAYDTSNAERMRQLQALGIEESAAVVGGDTVSDRANALSNIARMLEASQARNTGYENAALTLNEQMKGVARLQGSQQQAAVQQAMAEAMAKAAAGGTTTVGMSPSQILSMANSVMKEQDKMNRAITAPNIDMLWQEARKQFPDNPSAQAAYVRTYQ